MREAPITRRSALSLWSHLGGAPPLVDALEVTGPEALLPSRFAVTPFASAAVGVATLAVAELFAARTGAAVPTALVSSPGASAAFRSEALFTPRGWELPPVWDPIAGDYRARDRFVRLHTNYASHRAAALSALGVQAEKSAVAAAVAAWEADALERAVVSAGGCAAAMYSRDEWRTHEHGGATLDEPPVTLVDEGALAPVAPLRDSPQLASKPLAGVRVLDLTRVLAGPVCTRFLSAHGASVLRLDPPGFEEVPAVVPDVSAGKRRASLDLRTDAGKRIFDELVASADVLVTVLRPGALEAMGLDTAHLRAKNPALVIARLDAYGWSGPWSARRGFDSLVQMSCGIAHPGSSEGRPSPLPAQALDHGAGYLLAAGVCRALTRRVREGRVTTVRAALLGVANHLWSLGETEPAPALAGWPDEVFEEARTAWGPARRVRCPGNLQGFSLPAWGIEAGPLGSDEPAWSEAP